MFYHWTGGRLVKLPDNFKHKKTVRGRIPNEVMLTIDDCDFQRLLGEHAEWVMGEGPYCSVAYCRVLTVARYATLEDAIKGKRTIDSTGCGGCCHKGHMLMFCDPANPETTAQDAAIAALIDDEGRQP